MPRERRNRQSLAARDRRNQPFTLKLTRQENAALVLVGAVRGMTPQDLIRERSINAVVREYDRLERAAKVAAAS